MRDDSSSENDGACLQARRWTVVLPYFNEEDYIAATLASLLAQTLRPFTLVLVDNASTDRSTEVCRAMLEGAKDVVPVYGQELRPGKTNALELGLQHVDTAFVALCDADTHYPPHYLKRCDALFASSPPDVVAVMAVHQYAGASRLRAFLRQAKVVMRSLIYTKQCLTGGCGQCFRTAALKAVGGFSTRIWPFVFEDHEIMQRIFKIGRSRYAFDLWCIPAERRNDRSRVDWTYWERRLYGVLPFAFKDWYFYSFLRRRFEARGLYQTRLREKSWLTPDPRRIQPAPASAVAADAS